jgi:dipeptidyl aminopeptidase/acylaminoacyl peptidase
MLRRVHMLETSSTEGPEIIERRVLFGNPERAAVQISPDGRYLSFLAPKEGVLNLFVAPRDEPTQARAITDDRGRGIQGYHWAYTGRHILYVQDKDGDENWRIYLVDLETSSITNLTPYERVQARVQEVSPEDPEAIVIGINAREPRLHDLYRVDLRDGSRTLLYENTEGFAGFLTHDHVLRLGVRMTPTAQIELLVRDGETWRPLLSIDPEDALTTGPLGFDDAGKLYMRDSRGRNTSALTRLDLINGHLELLAEDDRADLSGALVHPRTDRIQAAYFTYERRRWQVLDGAVAPDIELLTTVEPGELEVVARTVDDRHWVVAYLADDGPVRYYHYDRERRQTRFLFTNRPALENVRLARMHSLVLESRDGLPIVSYLTLPPDQDFGAAMPKTPLPLVLLVHGGPWARDSWGFDPNHQWLANRGYAVLSVNYRGSTGFGKAFINAGNGEWAGRMQDDLVDALGWAVDRGIADPQRAGIMGGSYGGYAVLVGLTFTPELFACGVDIVGPSNLVTLIQNVPPYWMPILPMLTVRMGDPRTEEGKRFLLERSPLSRASAIRRPLLIGQGANDPRVKQEESEQIVRALQSNGIPVTYVLYPDEGHGFVRPENRLSFFAITEAFLAHCLGGRRQLIEPDLEGATLEVRSGVEIIPGLQQALQKRGG